ncbi:MAG TPA: MmcQ/YjbR family DNA-binding protein [Acidimicrobiales bacterium]|nr:MmcQ/YjbR family DNA-binding protein [Acidimicrobiales bacterium]
MAQKSTTRVARIRQICLGLPEAVEKPFALHESAPGFRVRDKFFVMCNEDASVVNLKAPKGAQAILVGSDPDRFFVPRYVGSKGWVGIRLDLDQPPDWDEITEMIYESYCMTAPKRLAAQVSPTA